MQRSFFLGDVIAITSWAPDVVNSVRPILIEVGRTEILRVVSHNCERSLPRFCVLKDAISVF